MKNLILPRDISFFHEKSIKTVISTEENTSVTLSTHITNIDDIENKCNEDLALLNLKNLNIGELLDVIIE